MKDRNIFALLLLIISSLSFGQTQNLFKIVENDKIGYINQKGVIVIEPKFLSGNDFSDGLASVRQDGRYGFIDPTGNFVIKPKYDFASSFYKGIASVYVNGKPYFIDKNDKIILDTIYNSIQIIDKKKAIVQTELNNIGILDLSTKKLIADTIFQSISNFEKEVAIVTKKVSANDTSKLKYAVIDDEGNYIVNFDKYEEIIEFVEGYARVEVKDYNNTDGNIDGVIDTKGNLLFQRPYKNHSYISGNFHNGLAIVSLYKYWIPEEKGVISSSKNQYKGFINLKGDVVLNDTLNKYLNDFSNNRTFIKDADRNYRIIDTNFQPIGDEIFDDIQGDRFRNDYAIVEKDNSWGIIDTNGKYIIDPKFDEIHEIGIIGNYFFYRSEETEDENLYGISDIKGKILTAPIIQDFDQSGFINGIIKAIVDDKLTYIDQSGNIVWQQKKTTDNFLKPLNIDFMNRASFYAYSEPNDEDLGGFGSSNNFPNKIKSQKFPKNKISVIVNPTKLDTISEIYNGFNVYVVNNTTTNLNFSAQDSRLDMKVQAKNEDGQWRDIEYLPSSWCGNSYHTLSLKPKYYWTFTTPNYEGEIKTKLRVELKYTDPAEESEKEQNIKEITIYSNEYDGSINPGQFWNKRTYYPNGLMDPYND